MKLALSHAVPIWSKTPHESEHEWTLVNTSEHEWTQVNTNRTRVNTNGTQENTSEHEWTRMEHEQWAAIQLNASENEWNTVIHRIQRKITYQLPKYVGSEHEV